MHKIATELKNILPVYIYSIEGLVELFCCSKGNLTNLEDVSIRGSSSVPKNSERLPNWLNFPCYSRKAQLSFNTITIDVAMSLYACLYHITSYIVDKTIIWRHDSNGCCLPQALVNWAFNKVKIQRVAKRIKCW